MSDTTECKYCGAETRRLATRRCDNCWEVSVRLKCMPLEIIERILADVRVEFLQKLIKRSHEQGVNDERSRASVRPGRGDMGG